MSDDNTFRARMVSFDHSRKGAAQTLIVGVVQGALGEAIHGEVLDVEVTFKVVRRMRSLVPLGDVVSALHRLSDVPRMVEDSEMVIIEGREAQRHEGRDKCVCGERPPASCVCVYMSDDLYAERLEMR